MAEQRVSIAGVLPSYSVTPPIITGNLAVAQKNLLSIWHPNTNTNRITLARLEISIRSPVNATGSQILELWRITAAPTGGVAVTPELLDNADAVSAGMVFQSLPTGGATLATTRPIWQKDDLVIQATNTGQRVHEVTLRAFDKSKLPILRPSVAEGWAIIQNVDVVIPTTAPKFVITVTLVDAPE